MWPPLKIHTILIPWLYVGHLVIIRNDRDGVVTETWFFSHNIDWHHLESHAWRHWSNPSMTSDSYVLVTSLCRFGASANNNGLKRVESHDFDSIFMRVMFIRCYWNFGNAHLNMSSGVKSDHMFIFMNFRGVDSPPNLTTMVLGLRISCKIL